MPSPFPGMDPYLEGAEWLSFHGQLVAEFGRQLAPKVLPKYLALMGQREVISISESDDGEGGAVDDPVLYADAAVVRARADPGDGTSSENVGGSVRAPFRARTIIGRPAPERFLEIRDARDRRLVTLIELLSPTNKRGDGYLAYVEKRNHVLRSKVHLIEIDLHHGGRRVPMRDALRPAPYYVFLSRAEERPTMEVWPVRLDEPLPKVPVPLDAPDRDVQLDLQEAFTNVYDGLGYRHAIDYTEPPPVKLDEAAAKWVTSRLKATGFAGH